jgi:hypothetical protein
MVAPYWDDLYDNENFFGEILYYNDEENHLFIVEWDSISHNHYVNEPFKENFQVILYDPDYYPTATGDGEIIVQYRVAKDPSNVTVGIENQTQDIGLQYLYNNFYDPTASAMVGGKAIKFTTEPPFANILTAVDENLPGSGHGNGPAYELGQNHPNPFISRTWIDYKLPSACHVTISIYNVSGELITVIVDGQQGAGKHTVEWDGMNDAGVAASPGVYFYRIRTDDYTETGKMFMLK